MGKSQWNPWRVRDDFRQQVERFLDEADQAQCRCGGAGYVWTPRADVLETARNIIARVELPGVAAEQVVVEVVDGDLVVRGERPCDGAEPEPTYHIMERAFGAFARRFSLPVGVDVEGVSATLRDGLLTVTVPKQSAKAPQRTLIVVG